MVRSVDSDFSGFLNFVETYDLAVVTSDAKRRTALRSAHKIYLASLHLWSRCNHMAEHGAFELHARKVTTGEFQMLQFKESIADLGSGLLCAVHGLYKQAQTCLRSSIENFVRFSTGVFDENAAATTSVFDLFASARTAPMYASDVKPLNKLHSIYGDLCKFVHSSTLDQMTGNHALETFPVYSEVEFQAWLSSTRAVVKEYYTALIFTNRAIYLRAHFRTQEVFDLVISAKQRSDLLGRGA